jgi:UDP-N-acetylglucosamine:LPS N-acetylglucosamine transferase
MTTNKGLYLQPEPDAPMGAPALVSAREALSSGRPLWPARRGLQRDIAAPHDAPRVLLLTSTLGAGHLRAAQAVETAMRRRLPQATIETLDFWSLMDRQVAYAVRQAYLRLVRARPDLYDRIYQLDQRTWRQMVEGNQALLPSSAEVLALLPDTRERRARSAAHGSRFLSDRIVFPLLCAAVEGRPWSWTRISKVARVASIQWVWARLSARLEARLDAFRPDAVVITQMHPGVLLSSIKRRRRLNLATLAVLTDFGLHDFWIQPGIDRYCIAHEDIIGLEGAEIDPARLVVTGMPLMPGFSQPPSAQQARAQLGLDPHAPIVLVLGGGLGLGVESAAEQLLSRPGDWQVVVTAGHNGAACSFLAKIEASYGARLRVLGWTERMETAMCAADIVVGKPGGLTVAEALACARPLVATRSLGGQEGFNVRFLERHGAGRLVPEGELVHWIESALRDRAALSRMREAMMRLGRRDGAERIAELALNMAQARRAASAVA